MSQTFRDRMVNRYPTHDVEPYFEIEKIESFFNRELPKEIQLTPFEKITNVRRMVDNHISYLRENPTKPTYYPYYSRLLKLAKLL